MTLAMPYRDDSRTTLAFSLAVLLHILLAVAVVGYFFFQPAREPTQNKVFELVAAPPSDSPTDEDAAPGPPSMTLPTLAAPNIPTPPQPAESTPAEPTPAPAVVTPPPTPTPALSHATPVVPKPSTNQPKLTDYQKFQQQYKLHSTPAQTHATGRPTPSVSVNVNSIVKNLENAGSGANGQGKGRASASSSAETQDYLSKLVTRLQQVFVPPGGASGLSADIELVIGANGELVVKRIIRPSGNADFDNAVREALQQLTNVDPPPGGVQASYKFTYTPDGQ